MTKARKNIIKYSTILLTVLLLFLSFSYAASSWINKDSMWTNVGCSLNVKNLRTNKWTAVSNREATNKTCTWDSGINIGDELYIDAYTCYNGGKLWIYEDGICVRTIDAESQEHIYYEWTVRTTNMRVACSDTVNATTGESLSITIVAGGDSQAPVVTLDQDYYVVGASMGINITDNVAVTGYYVSKSSNKPSPQASGWIALEPSSETSTSYTPLQDGVFYVFAKDAVGNVSQAVTFEAGILPIATDEDDKATKVGESATFSGIPQGGTSPFTYKWYKNIVMANDNGTEQLIEGETGSEYTITAAKEDNNMYYFCEVTNRFGTVRSAPSRLTVYYPHTLKNIPDATCKLDQSHTFEVKIQSAANPNRYTYQWYVASTGDPRTSFGARVAGATSDSCIIIPPENAIQYYYCEVTCVDARGNALYTVASNRAKLEIDVTRPEVKYGKISPAGTKYISKNTTITIPITVTDTGMGYTVADNFTSEDIYVYVNEVLQPEAQASVVLNGDNGDVHNYILTLTNVTSNGTLKIQVPTGSILDDFGNENLRTNSKFDPEVTVDNIKATISQYSFLDGANGVYANKDKTIRFRIAIDDNDGIDKDEFTSGDIVVKVAGVALGSGVTKTVTFENEVDKKYIYLVTLKNVEGDGPLSITIPEGGVKDLAKNSSVETTIAINNNSSQQIIMDNTKPVIIDIDAVLDSTDSGTHYPGALSAWKNGWSNRDIYITITATDAEGDHIDYASVSRDGGSTFTKLTTLTDVITEDFNGNMIYQVYDMAGNPTSGQINIKIDKTAPKATPVTIYEAREGAAEYRFDVTIPSNKTLFVKTGTTSDDGEIAKQSGVREGVTEENGNPEGINTNPSIINAVADYIKIPAQSPNQPYSTYLLIRQYDSLDKGSLLNEWRETLPASTIELANDGFYEIQTTTTDCANNVTKSTLYKAYIKKRADNTIKISNIMDIGSGVKSLTINVWKGNVRGTNADKAINTIYVENPYKEYQTTVRLGKGTFYAEVILEDNSGLTQEYHKVITNNL